MDNNTLLEAIELQSQQATQLVKQTESMKAILTEVTNLKNEVDKVAVRTDGRLKEVEMLVEEVNKKVHIDDVEATTIASIVSKNANQFAREFFERMGIEASSNLFSSKKGQFIRVQYSRLKHYFNVTKYTHIKHTDAQKAFSYLESMTLDMFSPFETRMTPKQLEIMELEKTIA
ncbi:TPA: ORF6C domain-containing protein [Streptococcus agalactiae]|nr:ORF6C domain-containing protein [Streptococcus agalactiae]